MFSKLFRKFKPQAKAASVSVAVKSVPPPEVKADASAVWAARLQASLGDDAALLAVAREAPRLDIKQSAVAALVSEDALKQAEREFRTQNQGLHRLAKQRHTTLVAQRENRARAAKVIENAAALGKESMLPANRLVELDQAWQALDQGALTDELRSEYAALSVQLTAQLRQRGEQQQTAGRWLVRIREVEQRLNASCAAVAAGSQNESELAAAVEAMQRALADKPVSAMPYAGQDAARLEDACQTALLKAAEVIARHEAQQEAQQAIRQAQQAKEEESARRQVLAEPVAEHERAPEPAKKPASAALRVLPGLVKAAEDALAAGQLADARKQLQLIDQALAEDAVKLALSPALRARIDAVKSEHGRLKGWQQWGGGRVRDDLVDEAEALARSLGPQDESSAAKIKLKQLAAAIEQLRQRWQELDRLGGAGGKALWPRFDAALQAAYVPVAAQQAKLKAARDENYAARLQLIAQLDAIEVGPAADEGVTDWREISRALENFDSAWRKLGPVDHTVPHKMRDGLLARKAASLARIESPLHDARGVAQAERQKFITRAKALSAGGGARDVVAKIRELQAEWQHHARTMPLSRAVENALWAEFKAATDAVFKQREAEHSARDEEIKAHLAAREALIGRLAELNAATPPDEIERSVASIDRSWRSAGEVAPGAASSVEQRFRAARAAALQLLDEFHQRAWQATCDALRDKLALCEAAESAEAAELAETTETTETTDAASAAPVAGLAEFSARWPMLPVLPPAWEDALLRRFNNALALSHAVAPSGDEPASPGDAAAAAVLLRLEAALDIASPPAFQSARREFKLQTMKKVLERRAAADADEGRGDDIARLLAEALGLSFSAASRDRLSAIIAALRQRPALGNSMSAGPAGQLGG